MLEDTLDYQKTLKTYVPSYDSVKKEVFRHVMLMGEIKLD